jgi:hypothetical protein
MWWSGLKASQVREGIEFLPPTFHKEVLNGKDYIYLPLNQKPVGRMQYSFLLPDYDEYGISYKNRDAYAPKNGVGDLHKMDSGYKHFLVINGRISGKWRRIEKKGNRIAEALCLSGLSRSQIVAAGKAVKKYNRFLNPGKIK